MLRRDSLSQRGDLSSGQEEELSRGRSVRSSVGRHSLHLEQNSGYRRLTALWSAIVSRKVTEALLATAASATSAGSTQLLLNMDTEQVLLLSLIHSLIRRDAGACFALSEISAKVEPLKSPRLTDWLQKNFTFSCPDIRSALSFAAELSKSGLVFPELVLSLLENLYLIYCSPTRRDSFSGPVAAASHPAESPLPLVTPKPKPRHLQEVTPLKHTLVFSNKILTGYNNCEKLALERENSLSPKVIETPSPRFKDFPTPLYSRVSNSSKEFVRQEVSSASLTAISELAAEADAMNEKSGDTALHLAVARENLEAVKALIRRGANVDVRNKVGVTPFQIAVERENPEIMKTLHEAGADINLKNEKKESYLHIAASMTGIETIELLIELGADPDSLDNRNQTPLFRATKKGYLVVMEKLEENGADIQVTDTFGRSLLHYAAWHGQTEAVDWLLKNSLDIQAKTKHGWSPLHWAVANRQIQTAHLLLQRGAEVNARDSAHRTPLYWATEAGNLALIDLLSSYHGVC